LTSVTGYRLDGILSSGALPKFWSLHTDIRPRAGETWARELLAKKLARP
jgi:hypothetical protein